MPYYRCRACGVTSYSAAGYSSVGICPECSTPLTDGMNGGPPPEPAFHRRLPARPDSAPEARRAIDALGLVEETREKLALLASELVTNAVRHSGVAAYDPNVLDDAVELLLTQADGEMRLAVRDCGPGFAPPQPPRGRTDGGLGFVIVDALSKAWGVDCHDRGCTVWCTLETAEAA